MRRSIIWAIVFGVIGYFIPIFFDSLGPSGTSDKDIWGQFFVGLVLCPPIFLVAMSATDPSSGVIWFMIAPANALLYSAVGYALARKLSKD